MITRRNFLTKSASASAAFATGISASNAAEISNQSKIENKGMVNMKLAAISWTFGLEDLDELFEKVNSIGYNALQFCGDFKKYSASEVLAVAKKYEVEITSYDPINCKPESDEQATLENSVAFYKKVIDYAEELGAPMATLQGLSFWTINEKDYEKAMLQIIEAVRQLNDYGKQKNILLTYEACCHYETTWVQTADELIRIKEEADADNVKLVLDSFHMNIGEKDMLEPIRKIGGDALYSYHVSDSGRGGIGTGHIDYIAQYNVLKEIGFDDLLCFEIVIPECRPYKLPMNKEQMAEFTRQSKKSLNFWKTMMEES